MQHVFFIVDCSGSIIADGMQKVGQINDLIHDIVDNCVSAQIKDIRVVCFGNSARIYWEFTKDNFFLDIPPNRFGGRSNLGQAYTLLRDILNKENIQIEDCIFILLSDGEATDNYKLALNNLDSNNSSIRLALSLGNSSLTTEKHVSMDEYSFKNGVKDRDSFISKIMDCIK